VFLAPILKGLALVLMVFAVLLSVLIPMARSDPAGWPVLGGAPR
jgi:hypothetical protein